MNERSYSGSDKNSGKEKKKRIMKDDGKRKKRNCLLMSEAAREH